MKTFTVKWNFIKVGGPQHWTGWYESTFGPHNQGVLIHAESGIKAIQIFEAKYNANPAFLIAQEETEHNESCSFGECAGYCKPIR